MYHAGRIVRKQLASPTVMVLELNVPDLQSFLPGQWVDFVVPPHSWIGGFSIASSPQDLPNITLAVKKSNHPPATWVHEKSKLDQEVQVQVGGTCVLPAITSSAAAVEDFISSPPRIFCAGGIGISPVLSQYREFLAQRSLCIRKSDQQVSGPVAKFLYSVSSEEELVFANELAALANAGKGQNQDDEMVFTLTQSSQWSSDAVETYKGVDLETGRRMRSLLDRAPNHSIFYLCGPPGMMDDAFSCINDIRGIDSSKIHYEKWW